MGRLFVALTALPFLADLLDRFIAWATKKYRREIDEGDEYPPFSLVLWTRVVHRNPDYDHDLWVVKLPCWQFRYLPWQDDERWAQFALFNRRPFQRREIFNGDGWKARWLEVR